MNIEWIAEDTTSTIGHATKLVLDNHTILSPGHLLTSRDFRMADDLRRTPELGNSGVCIAGHPISYSEYKNIGKDPDVLESVRKDLNWKMNDGKANIIFQRIPASHTVNDTKIDVKSLDDFQTAGIVNIQLELKSSVVIPPLYSEISSQKQAHAIYERTKTEIQTFNTKSDIIGFIPNTHDLQLVSDMVKTYLKDGIRFFAIDFSSSPLNRFMLRVVVSSIRRNLKISGKVGEKTDKQYYLHVFDISANQKSVSQVSAITDVLTHIYGVDSTSGVIWGGGKMVKDKLRYFDFSSYGAIQTRALNTEGINYNKDLVDGSVMNVYEKLRTQKNIDYNKESKRITSLVSTKENAYRGYLETKDNAKDRIKDALIDVNEIKSLT